MNFAALRFYRRFTILSLIGCLLTVESVTAQGTYSSARSRMVDEVVVGNGIADQRIGDAMRQVPRHEFVPIERRRHAYFDVALPIGHGQTISSPFIVALMTKHLDPEPGDRVLEIGTGSGYQAAVLSVLVKDVYTIEIVAPLGRNAKATFERLGYSNVHTRVGDGYQGWPEQAPFDKIIVTCSPQNIPPKLVEQLREGGLLVVPLGERFAQTLYLFRKLEGEMVPEVLEPTMFVPMTGLAEQVRQEAKSTPDAAIINGDLEKWSDEGEWPAGWYYLRQAARSEDPANGNHFVTFTNRNAGRPSQMLQPFAVDGSRVDALEVSLGVSAELVMRGIDLQEQAGLVVSFYNRDRELIGQRHVPPFSGSFDWAQHSTVMDVPDEAVTAILAVGLFGATGKLSVDDIEVSPQW